MIGKTLGGRYRVLRPIGEGGIGVVYEAEQLDLRRRVALKVLHDADARSIERFIQEAQATANLASPHVVTVLEFSAGSDVDPPFLVMELLAGDVLSSVLKHQGKLSVTRSAEIAVQMLAGLAAAHRAGIIHRDVKPSNVFLVPNVTGGDIVKLLDFGIAKIVEGAGVLTTTGVLVGTPAYVAPEQLRHQAADARTDLHAVGVCLYEMLAGRRPWQASGPELSAAILRDPPLPLVASRADVPPGIVAVIERALAKDRAHRFATADEMLDALRPWTSNGGVVDATTRTPPVHGLPPDTPNTPNTPNTPDTPNTPNTPDGAAKNVRVFGGIATVIAIAIAAVSFSARELLATHAVVDRAPVAPTTTPPTVAEPLRSASVDPPDCVCIEPALDELCTTMLCDAAEERRCTCYAPRGSCKVPLVGGRCPSGMAWTGNDVVPEDAACTSYRSGRAADAVTHAMRCSVCYTPKRRSGFPDGVCSGVAWDATSINGRWRCGDRAPTTESLAKRACYVPQRSVATPLSGTNDPAAHM